MVGLVFLTLAVQAKEANIPGTYEKGTITLSNDKTIEGYIWNDVCNPRKFQLEVSYIDEKVYKKWAAGKKIKKKMINTLSPKKVSHYEFENGRFFEKIKYVDLTATSTVGMLPKNVFAERLAVGKINIYKLHHKTTNGKIPYDILSAKNEGGEIYKEYMEDNFMILFQKDKSKNPKISTVVNMKKLLEDNQTVFENYQENFYGFQEEFTKPSSFGSNVHMAFQTSLLKLIADYNK